MANRYDRARQRRMEQAAKRAFAASRRVALRQFRKTPVGQLVQQAQRVSIGRGSARRMEQLTERVQQLGGSAMARNIEAQGGVMKYAANEAARLALNNLLRALGPLGQIFSALLGMQRKASSLERQLQSAVKLLEAFGYDVISPTERRKNRALDAALTAIEEEESRRGRPMGAKPALAEPVQAAPIWAPGREYGEPTRPEVEAFGQETRTPGSSNVYSFSFTPENDRTGTLYVTFRPWWPGMKGNRPNSRGPMYAYFDLPFSRYREFAREAMSSAGGAVWRYLRVHDSQWDHQYDYRLVFAKGVTTHIPVEGGQYVPRKITSRGYIQRQGFRGFMLPSRTFGGQEYPYPYRAPPDRAFPNRAEPNRGR